MKKLLAILLSVMLLVGALPLTAYAEMGGDFPWTGTSDKMLIEEILERDGFIDGIWFPWFNAGQTGHNLTGNDLMADYYNSSSTKNWDRVEMDYYGADKIYREIYNLKAMGYNIMAYGGSIFGEGVIFDENGDVLGIKEEYLTNARRLLNMCREIGMPVMWNIYFHDSSMPSYYGMEGWHVICQMLGNNEIADHYAERFVRPLCEMLNEYRDVVALVSIADEPENQVNDLGKGDHFETKGREMYGVNHDDMIYFMQQINEVAREELPGVARTVACNNGNKTIYRDFDLDLMGHNQYTDGNSFKSVESLITDADPILTEYNIGGSVSYTDDQYAQKLITFREWMMNNGYKGGFQWCWMPNSTGTGTSYFLQRLSSDPTSFRKTVSLLKYYMDEYRAAYRGETIGLDAPVLYANAGNGKVLWIPSQNATTITIQRSDDGGSTWTNLVTNVAQSTYVDNYLVGRYTDSTTRPTSGYCYRIIAYDASGNSVTSEANNLAGADKAYMKTYTAPTYTRGKYYITSTMTQSQAKLTSFGVIQNRPLSDSVNLIQNGSFESTGGQWNNSSFLQYAQVVNDSTTPDGSKSLYFDTSANGNEGWYTFTVTGLKKNTEYTFSSFIKGAYLSDNNKGQASIGVIDPDTGKYMFYWEYFRSYPRASRETKQMYPTAYDDEWHIRSVTFNSGDLTTATIALYGYSSQIWVDGLALFESTNGMKYETGESSKAITTTEYNPASGATNAVTDPNVNDASYWNTGAGYKQGFMSITGGKLKYTASSDPKGVRYTKWIDVKPGTDYYVSYTVNVTTAGSGRVAILDNAMLLPFENLTQSFSSTGTKTVTGRISTGKYDQLGLCVVDLGGVATIDNICLYEGGESVVLPTNPSYDGYIINGDFEIGSSNNWENLWNNNSVEIVAGRDSSFALQGTANSLYAQVRQKIAVEPNTDYIVEVWAKNVTGTTLIVKDSADQNLKQTGLQGSGSTWTKTTLEFNSGANEFVYLGLMGGTVGATYTVDDISMRKKTTMSDDGFIVNGDFEVGTSSNWENVWNSNTINIVAGHDSSYGMQVNANLYTVVRETVSVKANTDYVIEVWSKDCVNACLLVKDSADRNNIVNYTLPTGSTWTHTVVEFNTGSNTTVYVGFMGAADGAYYTVDDVKMYEKEVTTGGLINGDFEDGDNGWTYGSGSHAISSDAHSGNGALQLTNPGLWASAAEQTIEVEPNTSYTITWWYKATSGTGLYNLYVMNANGYANLTAEGGQNYMRDYTGAWQQGRYVVNTGSATSIILKWSTEASNPGTILIDDIVVAKTEDLVCTHTYTSAITSQPTCGATGVLTYTCSLCGDSYTETIPATGVHNYDNACDTDCNVCGATRTASHVYSGSCDQYCDLCGARKTSFVIAMHTYDNACDGVCNVCGFERTVTGHSYDNDCDADCNTCGTVRDAAHKYDNDCDDTCNVCGAARAIAGHNYVESVMANPTCGSEGMSKFTCSSCGDSYTKVLPATGNHKYDNDCDAVCNLCFKSREVGDHNYVGVQTKAPTCTAAGEMTYTCSSCGDSYTEGIDALGHTAGPDADCENAQTCAVCGETLNAAIGHNYKGVVTAPDCENGGYTTYTCTACGDSYVDDYTEALGHDYESVVTAPDCVNGGYTTYTCSACGDSYVDDYTEATGHNHVGVQTKAPTCTETGVKTYTCSDCGDSYTEEIAALGHTAGAAADCENAQVCTVCGTELNAALGHSYTAAVTAPDCVNGGYTTYTCSACGDSYVDDYTAALGHTYSNDYDVDCDVCGDIRTVDLPISFGGNSVSEDVSGLAFKFDVEVEGMTVNGTTAVYDNATIDGYKLIGMGAVLANKDGRETYLDNVDGSGYVVDVPAMYLCDLEENSASYAVRVINIPENHYDTVVRARPYFIYEDAEGNRVVAYGAEQSATYEEVSQNIEN